MTNSIDLVCQSLEVAVQNYIQKHSLNLNLNNNNSKNKNNDDNDDDGTTLVQKHLHHACHILRVLSRQRASLHIAIQTLNECWTEYFQHHSTGQQQHVPTLLLHVFFNVLRLRDAFILMTSGECRHATPTPPTFTSKLPFLNKCTDGYTQLYKSTLGYSGESWDEFMNDKVGVKHLLQQALRKHNNNKRRPTLTLPPQLELELDNHETLMKQYQLEFDHWWKDTVVRDLKRFINAKHVTWKMQDKMEQWQVTTIESIILLERNKFYIKGEGVLPIHWTRADWKKAMHMETIVQNNKLESTSKINQKLTSGIKVKVTLREKAPTTKSSLNEIKRALGVNALELETSREALEQEECAIVPSNNNIRIENDTDDLLEEIQAGRQVVQRYKSILERALNNNNNDDDYEVWDAREMLRKQIMSLGSQLLSLADLTTDKQPTALLMEARDLFSDAKAIVMELEAQCNTMTKNDKIQRRLVLLRGRALTNHGIAIQEIVSCSGRTQVATDAIVEFKRAMDCTSDIRKSAHLDKSNPMEAAMDILQADQLECLAGRWLATALWNSGQRDAAMEIFLSTSQLFRKERDDYPELVKVQIEMTVDCYYCCVSWMDLASHALETLPLSRSQPVKWGETKIKGDELLAIVLRAYDTVKSILSMLQRLCGDEFASTTKEYSITSLAEMDAFRQELTSWWKAQKDDKAIIAKGKRANLPRSDVFATDVGNRIMSHQRFIVSNTTSRKLTKKRYGAVSFRPPYSNMQSVAQSPAKKRYMLWGNERLPQVKDVATGEMVPLIAYPSVAPPLPPEMQGLMLC